MNGYNVISKYNRIFAYAGVAFEYSGTNADIERLSTAYARQLKRNLTIEVWKQMFLRCVIYEYVSVTEHFHIFTRFSHGRTSSTQPNYSFTNIVLPSISLVTKALA